jgi:hypothetical protein
MEHSEFSSGIHWRRHQQFDNHKRLLGGGYGKRQSRFRHQRLWVVGGGGSNTASGDNSFIGAGTNNAASGKFSSIVGGAYAVADKYGQRAFASSTFVNPGEAQQSDFIWRITTSDATAGVEMLDGDLGGLQRAVMASGKSWAFDIIPDCPGSSGCGYCMWTAKGLIHHYLNTVGMTNAVTSVVVSDGALEEHGGLRPTLWFRRTTPTNHL